MLFRSPALAKEPKKAKVKLPAQGESCSEGKCGKGLTCITYFGIAGPSGPAFTSCEIPCRNPTDHCPKGQKCVTIPDGPGLVCQP